jgi:Tol biopolymer transport system component
MAEVYRARDTKLKRDVAIKVLPASFADDPKRVSRFEDEARTLASLNHPNIGAIYGLEEADGRYGLILELVEGPTLAERLRKRPPLRESLRIAREIAEALEAAHEKGIIHRDLKPENIKITPNGTVKVLDFGLAKAFDRDQSGIDLSEMPTRTEHGVIVGTPAYMSPEQTRGQAVTKQTDIWAFGCVLYQMLTGDRAFAGDTVSDAIAAVLEREPDWEALPPETPAGIRTLVERCLNKDTKYRLHDIADARIEVEHVLQDLESRRTTQASAGTTTPSRFRRWAAFGAAGVVVLALLAVAGRSWFIRPEKTPPVTSTAAAPGRVIPLTSYEGRQVMPSFSPEGTQVAFSWNGEKQDNYDIYVKVLGSETPLRLTSDPAADYLPRWSPDGRTIAFARMVNQSTEAIMLIPALGGPERKLAEVTSSRREVFPSFPLSGFSWSPDGKWLAVAGQLKPHTGPDQIILVSVDSGEFRAITDPHVPQLGDFGPAFSPDGRSLVFVRKITQSTQLYRLNLNERFVETGEPVKLPTTPGDPDDIVWSGDGQEILFAAGGNLHRMPAAGTVDPTRFGPSGGVVYLAISPKGNRLAISRMVDDPNIYRLDLTDSHAVPQRFAYSKGRDVYPQYSPDGKRVAFYSTRSGRSEIWTCDADGTRPLQLTPSGERGSYTPRWSPDGSQIIFDSRRNGSAEGLYQVYIAGADGRAPRALTEGPSSNFAPSFSRDGRWIYFASSRDGTGQVWKMPAGGGQPVQVTRNGGNTTAESPDGKTLYFNKQEGSGSLWKMPVAGGPEVQVLSSLYRFNFSVADKGVYFTPATSPKDGTTSIQFLDFASGAIRTILPIGIPDTGLAVSPDGRYLLFVQVDRSDAALGLIENFQ